MFRGPNTYQRAAMALTTAGAVLLAGCSASEASKQVNGMASSVQEQAGNLHNDLNVGVNAAGKLGKAALNRLQNLGMGFDQNNAGTRTLDDGTELFSLGPFDVRAKYPNNSHLVLTARTGDLTSKYVADIRFTVDGSCADDVFSGQVLTDASQRYVTPDGINGLHFTPHKFNNPDSSLCDGNQFATRSAAASALAAATALASK